MSNLVFAVALGILVYLTQPEDIIAYLLTARSRQFWKHGDKSIDPVVYPLALHATKFVARVERATRARANSFLY